MLPPKQFPKVEVRTVQIKHSSCTRIPRALALLLTAALATMLAAPGAKAQPRSALALDLDPASVPHFASELASRGLVLKAGDLAALTPATRFAVVECGGPDWTDGDATNLGEWVRAGGSLLITLSRTPGSTPLRLAFLAPSTMWNTQLSNASRGGAYGEITGASGDPALFPAGAPAGLDLPYYFQIRPWHAVERGEQRYEQFPRVIPYVNETLAAGTPFWTRPLLNRDWNVRILGDDSSASPLLITGRYGAGRVAVFASGIAGIDGEPGAHALWDPVLKWLVPATPATPTDPVPAQLPAPVVAVDRANHALSVALTNPNPAPLPVELVAREMTWEGALIGDEDHDMTLPGGGSTTVTVPLPAPGPTGYQAENYRDAYQVHLGILGQSGANLLWETRFSPDFTPEVTIGASTDNLRSTPYPFDAPGYNAQDRTFPNRLGMPVSQYAYPPGATAHVTVNVANGLHNLAPSATVEDLTTPDNPSVPALTDGAAMAESKPIDGVTAYGTWAGVEGKENDLSFTFSTPVTVAAITLNGAADYFRQQPERNPAAVIVEADGKPVLDAEDLDQRFVKEYGLVRLSFAPATLTTLRLRLPWHGVPVQPNHRRGAPTLGEVEILGWSGSAPAPASGTLTVALHDALTGQSTPLLTKTLTVAPGELQSIALPVTLPPVTGNLPNVLRIETSFSGVTSSTPVLELQPSHPLQSIQKLRPPDAASVGFIVTRGFRNIFANGTGTRDMHGSWETQDDLIWAYAHNMKQIGAGARSEMDRLFVTENNFGHYSTPWRSFPNGEAFFDVGAPLLEAKMAADPHWKMSDIAELGFGDRWDTGPSMDTMHGWQDFVGFDDYLRAHGQPGLKGRTRTELATEIHGQHEAQWQEWNLERYVAAVTKLHDVFAAAGKTLVLSGQGMPLVPTRVEAPLAAVIAGQSDDSTWGMGDEDLPETTGRQMAVKAFDPAWRLATLFNWGWDSAVLNNPHWHVPADTTEPARRHIYDRAFRGTIDADGQYESIHTFGYNMNGGESMVMTPNDWQESWRAQERHSLLSPDAPLGIGLIVGVERANDPKNTAFSGGGMGGSGAEDQIGAVARAVSHFQNAGLPVSFAANAPALDKWSGTAPVIALDLNNFTDEEVAALAHEHARGAGVVALAGDGPLSAAAAALFGVRQDGHPAAGHSVGEVNGRPVIAGGGTLLIPVSAADLTAETATRLAPVLHDTLLPPVEFPPGTSGYGFVSGGMKCVVLEDWLEQGRTVTLRVRVTPGATGAMAVEFNDHQSLTVTRDGEFWSIQVPLRPADGEIVGLVETGGKA